LEGGSWLVGRGKQSERRLESKWQGELREKKGKGDEDVEDAGS
jgi:hypothetical protein